MDYNFLKKNIDYTNYFNVFFRLKNSNYKSKGLNKQDQDIK